MRYMHGWIASPLVLDFHVLACLLSAGVPQQFWNAFERSV